MMDFLSNVSILCLPSASSSLCAGSDPQAGIPGLLCSGEWLLRPFHPVMTGKRANSGEEPVLQGRRWWGHREPPENTPESAEQPSPEATSGRLD